MEYGKIETHKISKEVKECRHPKWDPTEVRAKNALLQAEALSLVRSTVEVATERRIPRWWISSTSLRAASSRNHLLWVVLAS